MYVVFFVFCFSLQVQNEKEMEERGPALKTEDVERTVD